MKNSPQKRLCIFGCFDDTELYPRNRTLIDALSANFATSFEVRPSNQSTDIKKHRKKTSLMGMLHALCFSLSGFWSLAKQARIVRSADTIFIPYPAYLDLLFLKCILLFGPKPILIIDAFLCLHDTLVNDRKMLNSDSISARFVSKFEAYTLKSADLIFIDTEQQREYLLKSYELTPSKMVTTPVGIDETVWTPLDTLPLEDKFRLLFWGTFIPLHGIDTIIRSAQILRDTNPEIEIKLIGDGQTADAIAERIAALELDNINWERRLMSGPELKSNVEQSHCVLGVFGQSDKAGNVIPYKVYQAMASNKIVISRDGPALTDTFQSKIADSGLILIPPGDPEGLASAISALYKNYNELSQSVSTRVLYESGLSNSILQSCVNSALKSL